jgi:hypothetical protein
MSTENIEYSYQLSDTQQGMLFHTLHSPRAGAYIVQIICGLHENLRVGAFERAWQQVINHHSVLRTSFRWQGLDEPLQDVHRQVDVPFQQIDWRGMPADEHNKRLGAYLASDRMDGFDPADVPLLRLALFRLADADYRLVWTFHHLLLDGRCFPPIIKQVFSCYEAMCQGRLIELQSLPPYCDYIGWLQQRDLPESETFWREELNGLSAPTPLPLTDASSAIEADEEYATQEIRTPAILTSSLKSLAQEHGFSLNTIVQGAWAVLLSRYSGEENIAFGVTISCRRSSVRGAESMMGLLINTLPLHVRLSPEKPTLRWLKELRSKNYELRKHEHTPLVKIHACSDIAGGSPLFESILIFENYFLNTALRQQGGDWLNRDFRILQQTNYPLTICAYEDSELLLQVIYDRRRIKDGAIAQIFRHFELLLKEIAANPEQPLSELSMLTQAERRRLLVEWNDTRKEYTRTGG